MTRPKNLDLSQLAKRIVEEAVGEEQAPPPPTKNEKAARAGGLGGRIGAAKRAAVLSKDQKSEIAKKAAASRWKK